MIPFKHVLVPTDFGESADRALDRAIDIASQSGAKVTLFHVWTVPSAYSAYSAYGQGVYWPPDDIEREAKTTLETRHFLGSVAEKVVRLSPVPVLTVSTEAEKKARALALAHGADATKR